MYILNLPQLLFLFLFNMFIDHLTVVFLLATFFRYEGDHKYAAIYI